MRFNKLGLATALPMIAGMALLPMSANAEPETYTFDPTHTAIVFQIDHFGFSAPTGKFMNVEGELVLDEEDPAASSVKVTRQARCPAASARGRGCSSPTYFI